MDGIWTSFGLLHARILYARITRRVMRVLLPLNAVPLFSLRASHEAFNRTSLTALNPVNHGFKKTVLHLFARAKLRTVDKCNSSAIAVPAARRSTDNNGGSDDQTTPRPRKNAIRGMSDKLLRIRREAWASIVYHTAR